MTTTASPTWTATWTSEQLAAARESIALAKTEILDCVRSGVIDADEVESFSDLHGAVDANEFGGLTGGIVDTHGIHIIDFAAVVQESLNTWITDGDWASEL